MNILIIDDRQEIADMEKMFIDSNFPEDEVELITKPRISFLQELVEHIFTHLKKGVRREIDYDVVVLDFNLSDKENGLTLAALLRSISKDVRIILASANKENFSGHIEEIEKLDILVLEKPFSYEGFLTTLGHNKAD